MKIPSAPPAVGTGPASEEYPPAALPLITTEEFQDKPWFLEHCSTILLRPGPWGSAL